MTNGSPLAKPNGMIERYLLILLAVILTGSIGAFFLFVAILPVIAVAAVLTGLVVTFGLGFYSADIGRRLRVVGPSKPVIE